MRNPIATLIEDGADGVHDLLLAACDARRYTLLGYDGRTGCGDNLVSSMAELGLDVPIVPQPVNFSTSVEVRPDMTLAGGPNPVPPGGYIVLEAVIDVVCAASACPWDFPEPWAVNGAGGPTEIELEILPA